MLRKVLRLDTFPLNPLTWNGEERIMKERGSRMQTPVLVTQDRCLGLGYGWKP